MSVFGYGSPDLLIDEGQIGEILAETVANWDVDGRKVLLVVPDGTRTMPLSLFFRKFHALLKGRASGLGIVIALGTHQPMSETALLAHLGISQAERQKIFKDVKLYNHEWEKPETFIQVGEISRAESLELSDGLLDLDVPIRVNRLVYEYDLLVVCGPVFPHEVAGYSGGSKYFFPGISGPEVINFSHWLGALITTYDTIGIAHTPVRKAIERAAAAIQRPKLYCCPVLTSQGVYGLFCGDPLPAWERAVALSAKVHVRYFEKPFKRALSIIPHMYDDLWTGAKGMYKIDPVVADGGELIIYAPHITEVSYTHGKLIDEIGYHVRDYFTADWERFKNYPWGILAHSTHLRGRGTCVNGLERARIQVTLATGIPAERCAQIGLGYCDPASIRLDEWEGRESEGILLVPHAGETLYRLK